MIKHYVGYHNTFAAGGLTIQKGPWKSSENDFVRPLNQEHAGHLAWKTVEQPGRSQIPTIKTNSVTYKHDTFAPKPRAGGLSSSFLTEKQSMRPVNPTPAFSFGNWDPRFGDFRDWGNPYVSPSPKEGSSTSSYAEIKNEGQSEGGMVPVKMESNFNPSADVDPYPSDDALDGQTGLEMTTNPYDPLFQAVQQHHQDQSVANDSQIIQNTNAAVVLGDQTIKTLGPSTIADPSAYHPVVPTSVVDQLAANLKEALDNASNPFLTPTSSMASTPRESIASSTSDPFVTPTEMAVETATPQLTHSPLTPLGGDEKRRRVNEESLATLADLPPSASDDPSSGIPSPQAGLATLADLPPSASDDPSSGIPSPQAPPPTTGGGLQHSPLTPLYGEQKRIRVDDVLGDIAGSLSQAFPQLRDGDPLIGLQNLVGIAPQNQIKNANPQELLALLKQPSVVRKSPEQETVRQIIVRNLNKYLNPMERDLQSLNVQYKPKRAKPDLSINTTVNGKDARKDKPPKPSPGRAPPRIQPARVTKKRAPPKK